MVYSAFGREPPLPCPLYEFYYICLSMSSLSFPSFIFLFLRKYTATVVLAVKAVLGRKLGRTLIAVLLFKVRLQVGNAIFLSQADPDFIKLLGVL